MFSSLISRWAKLKPNVVAIESPRGRLTYRDLEQLSNVTAFKLSHLIPDGQKVVAIGDFEIVRTWVLTLALAKLGHVSAIAPKDPAAAAALQHDFLLVDAASRGTEEPRSIAVPTDWWSGWKADEVATGAVQGDWGTLARLIVSSGTTGTPKIVPFTHALILKRIEFELLAQSLGPVLGADTRLAVNIPGGVGGFIAPLVAWAVGGTVLFDFRPTDNITLFREHHPTSVVMATAQLQAVLDRLPLDFAPMPDLTVTVGGSILTKALADEAARRLTPNIYVAYGSTEGGVVSSAPAALVDTEQNEVGFLFPWMELEILDQDGNKLPSGEQGEIRVRSEASVSSYFGDANDQANKGWFYPGDVGSVSKNGVLRITGRTGDMVNTGSRKLAFSYIEEVVSETGHFKEVAAFKVTGADGFDQAWVAIVPAPTFDRHEFIETLSKNGGLGQVRVMVVDKVPKNEMGKIQRHLLEATAKQRR